MQVVLKPTVFAQYASFYNLLNRDKPYAEEADYVLARLREACGEVRSILDLGSGTGVHGRLLAERGVGEVRGVERSEEMVAVANVGQGGFSSESGDIRTVRLDRTFDAVTALFHVASYMTADEDLVALFGTARSHLEPGGVFLFDVWHGPAVLAQRPSRRERRAKDGPLQVVRTAEPTLDEVSKVVTVNFDFECHDDSSGANHRFSESHAMRFLFAEEVDRLACETGFAVIGAEEMLTRKAPSESTWAVTYVLRRVREGLAG